MCGMDNFYPRLRDLREDRDLSQQQVAEYLGMKCNKNKEYEDFCSFIFSIIKEQNTLHKTDDCMFNTEFVPRHCGHVKSLLIDSKLLFKDNEGQAITTMLCAAWETK